MAKETRQQRRARERAEGKLGTTQTLVPEAKANSDTTRSPTFWGMFATFISSFLVQSFGSSLTALGIKPYYVSVAIIFTGAAFLIIRHRKRLSKKMLVTLTTVLIAAGGGAIYGTYISNKPKPPFTRKVGYYKIKSGPATFSIPDELLEGQDCDVFENHPDVSVGGHVPLMATIRDGKLIVSIRLVIGKNVMARVHGWDVRTYAENWDANQDADKLEIVNEKGVPQLQLWLKPPDAIEIRGWLSTENGRWVYFTDEGISLDPATPPVPPKPIFKYPSSKYPEKLAG